MNTASKAGRRNHNEEKKKCTYQTHTLEQQLEEWVDREGIISKQTPNPTATDNKDTTHNSSHRGEGRKTIHKRRKPTTTGP